jgi:hypothetical protein
VHPSASITSWKAFGAQNCWGCVVGIVGIFPVSLPAEGLAKSSLVNRWFTTAELKTDRCQLWSGTGRL